MQPEISVIIPVYNAVKYIRKCIDSILCQTINNFELLLIDDGSNDGSENVIDKYQENDPRIKVIHKKNTGVSSTRNLGLQVARGNYIVFVDSDDYVSKDYLEKLYEYHEEDLVISGYQQFGFNTEGYTPSSILITKENFDKRAFEELLAHGYITRICWAKLFKKNILRAYNILFPEDMFFCEDSTFVFNYLQYCESVRYINYCGYYYYKPELTGPKYKLYTTDIYAKHIIKAEQANEAIANKWEVNMHETSEAFRILLFYGFDRNLHTLPYKEYKQNVAEYKSKQLYKYLPSHFSKIKINVRLFSMNYPFMAYYLEKMLYTLYDLKK